MQTSRRIGRALLSAAMALALPHFVSAEDADTKEVRSYTLTDSALAKYTDATQRLAALPANRANACDDEGAQTLAQMAAKLDAAPGAQAAIKAAGMTSREYVVFSMSLLQNGLAAWAMSQPGGKLPPGVSKANVDFIREHDAELKQLETLQRSEDCENAEGEDATDEQPEQLG